jgi:hypothetical protein
MRVCLVLFLLLVTDAGMLLAQTTGIARSQEYGFSVAWINLAWFDLAQESSLPQSGTPQKKTVEDQPQSSTSTESSVRPEDAVITLHGVCSSPVGATQEKDERSSSDLLR